MKEPDIVCPIRQASDPSGPTSSTDAAPVQGIGLCLSGGGYRAMLFHVGTLRRLLETGFLSTRPEGGRSGLGGLKRVSSVSGGSIAAAVMGRSWAEVRPDEAGAVERFDRHVTSAIRRLASTTIDVRSVLVGLLPFTSVNRRITTAYRKHLDLGDATLEVFPDEPTFVLNATNLQSGALWRFTKQSARDWKVGEIPASRRPIDLAAAIAASSAFPPVLSPARFSFEPGDFVPGSGGEGESDLQRPPFTTRPLLSDGGVYDNLGLETCWKLYRTILVSDAGGKLRGEGRVASNWVQQSVRVLDVIDNQVRSLRKRQLIDAYRGGARAGAFWGIRTDIAEYGLADSLACPHELTRKLAEIPTRLQKLDDLCQERLINWGYAICDAALRRYVDPTTEPPGGFPYPEAGVG